MPLKKPNIKDVADKAGVAQSTVSRVINNSEKVSEETYSKVKNAIKKLGYKPNVLARSMRTGKTSTIAVLLPDLKNLFFSELIGSIELAAGKRDYRVFICNSNEDSNRERVLMKDLLNRNVDGIILSSVSGSENLEIIQELKQKIPLIVVDRKIKGLNINTVAVDDHKGIYNATNYFIEKGHNNIAYVSGPLNKQIHETRLRGYTDALKDSGFQKQNDLIIEENFRATGGSNAVKKILSLNKKVTSIVFSNDMMAIGAIRALKSKGVKIPEEIELMGFDNIPLAQLIFPSLSTVAQPIKEIGLEAVKLLFSKMEEPSLHAREILLKTTFKFRETTK